MPNVTIQIGGSRHVVACRAGEEARVQMLGRMLDDRWAAADRAAAGQPDRAMLFVALMLADELHTARRDLAQAAARQAEPAPEPQPDPQVERRIEAIAARLEALAQTLDVAP